MRRAIPFLLGFLIVGSLALSVAYGQATTGIIYGRVLDPSGLAVPGADVTATNQGTSTTKSTVTNDRGEFTLSFLTVGDYTITVAMPGFKTHTETDLPVLSGERLNKTLTLQVGTPTETVTVTSEVALMNSVNAEQDINLSLDQVEGLPIARRDFSSLLSLGTGSNSSGTGLVLNGLPPQGVTFSVDGVDASQDVEFAGSIGMYQDFNYIKGVSVDAIQQVEVSKNIFSAEIGQTVSGNVNVITKSGTNSFHGSLFEYYQSGGLQAVDHFGARKEPQVFHQFGGSLGGPIVKDKVFFFGNYEGYRLTASTTQSGDVPSRWLRDQLSGTLPGADTFFGLWPLPTGPEQPGDVNANYVGVHPETRDDDHFSIRGDYNITDTDFLTARVTVASPERLSPRRAIGNPRVRSGTTRNFSTSYTRSWSPTFTSELRFGYNKVNVERTDLIWAARVPNMSVDGSEDTGGEFLNKFGWISTFEGNFSLTRGRHAMKFGGVLKLHRGQRINEESPEYQFDTVAAALANRADEATFQFILNEFQIKNEFYGLFVQDDIRLTPNFILNVGLRWDYTGVASERDGRYFNRPVKAFDPLAADALGPWMDPNKVWNPNYTDFSPRISFAWTVDEAKTTVVRAGYGIFYIPFNLFAGPVEIVKNGLNEPVEASFRSAEAIEAFGIQYPDYNDDVKPKVSGTGIEGDSKIDPNWDSSYSQQWTLGIQRQLLPDVVLDVAYVGNHGTKLIYSPTLNLPDLRFSGPPYITNTTAESPIPAGNDFRQYMTADSSTYHSLQATLKKRFSNSFSTNTSYTWASNLSHFRGQFTCCGSSEMPQDIFDLSANRGPTPYHIRHRFTTDFLWQIPFCENFEGVARQILGGWSVNGIVEAQSGDPLLIRQRGTRISAFRPDFTGASHEAAIFGNWDNPLADGTTIAGNNCGDHCYWYLDESAFTQAPVTSVTDAFGNDYTVPLRPGTLGRRSIYGPGEWTIDLSLAKDFQVTETSKAQFRADFFNFLNKTNLGNPGTQINRSNFGRIRSASSGRVVQFSLRYDF